MGWIGLASDLGDFTLTPRRFLVGLHQVLSGWAGDQKNGPPRAGRQDWVSGHCRREGPRPRLVTLSLLSCGAEA